MQLYSKENEGYNYMLTVIDCFSRFAFAKIFKNKSGDQVKNAFQSIFNDRIPKKIQTDQGTEFYNAQVKRLFEQEKPENYCNKGNNRNNGNNLKKLAYESYRICLRPKI